jgi:hypothetical protein
MQRQRQPDHRAEASRLTAVSSDRLNARIFLLPAGLKRKPSRAKIVASFSRGEGVFFSGEDLFHVCYVYFGAVD